MKKALLHIFMASAFFASGQIPKSQDLALLSFVKKGSVQLRWAPAHELLWRAGNLYGYKIERVAFEQYMEAKSDSLRFKNATLISSNAIAPWKQDDAPWKILVAKNKSAAFLAGSLYSADAKATQAKKEMTFGMAMKACDLYKELAIAGGFYFCDSSVTAGEVYVYRVSLWNAPKNLKYNAALIAVNTKELSALPKPQNLKAKFGNKKVVLSFTTLGVKELGGYWIERSEDSANYQTVNKSPFIRTTTKYNEHIAESYYGDSLPVNNKKYYYRIRGISYFGELSEPSNVVSGAGRPDFTEYPYIDSTLIIKNSSVVIKFHMPELADKNQLKHFAVYRSEKKNGAYSCIAGLLPKETILYTDEKPLESNYYKIAAISIYNDTSYSLATYSKLIDETPPVIPLAVNGTIDSSGIVHLSWTANTEKDLLGYRVYRSNSEQEQPVELTQKILTEPAFTDKITLNTLTRHVFYFVRAVDKVYNNSGYSKSCKLLRPDKIAPVPVVFKNITPTDSCIHLNWYKSSSNDVKKYTLYKKENSSDWKLHKEWPAEESKSQFADTSLTSEFSYQYKIVVTDETGNNSFTESHSVVYKPAFMPAIRNLKAEANLKERSIELTWNLKGKTVYSFTLYKAKGDEPLISYKTLDASLQSFTDKELYPGNKYRYAIKAIYSSGAESKLSEVLIVEF